MSVQAEQVVRSTASIGRGDTRREALYRSAAERRAEGKKLRDVVPRADHNGWKPPQERRDPIELALAQNEGRSLDLVPIRPGRMLQSPLAFYRGTAAIMAADLAHTPSSGLRVQAGGDAHLSNFGAFATPERAVGSADIQSLDDLANSYEVIRGIGPVPFGRDTIIQAAVPALIPFVPLALTVVPAEEILRSCWGCSSGKPES